MNGAIRTTAMMGILAAAVVAGAVYYYPKPVEVVVDAKVGQNLFEPYETSDVRSIAITQYSSESNSLEQLRVQRKGETWVLPQSGDFEVTLIARVGEVAKSLLDREVLSLATNDEQGHVEFGVVDPIEANNTPNRSSLGLKVELKDGEKGNIANLIIGKPVPGDETGQKFYVRVPGQPAVYELQIPKTIYRTRFENWVDQNLMQLPPPNSTAVKVKNIQVENYSIAPESIADAKRVPVYRSNFSVSETGLDAKLKQYRDGEFTDTELTPAIEREIGSTLQAIGNIRYIEVVGKPKAVATAMRDPAKVSAAADLKPLQQFGFRVSGEQPDFEAVGGEVSVATSDGVRVRFLIGSIAAQADTQDLSLNYHAMLVAEIDGEAFEEPTKPEGVEEDSEENKEYLRAMAELERNKQSAQLRIDEMNRTWSKWIYVVPETVISALRPEVLG